MKRARIIKITASCGHEDGVEVPPFAVRPGKAGQATIERAKQRPCFDCWRTARHAHPNPA